MQPCTYFQFTTNLLAALHIHIVSGMCFILNFMKKIVAVYKKKKLKTNWGFVFDTDVQMFVERFMDKIHISTNDYWLCFDEDKPEGIYTDVKVIPIENSEGRVIDDRFIF